MLYSLSWRSLDGVIAPGASQPHAFKPSGSAWLLLAAQLRTQHMNHQQCSVSLCLKRETGGSPGGRTLKANITLRRK